MRLVVIESPYAGDVEVNVLYARDAVADCLRRGEAPLAGHLLYTQVLNDQVPQLRRKGMNAHMAWIKCADALVVYEDRGVSAGMLEAISMAKKIDLPVERRTIVGWQK